MPALKLVLDTNALHSEVLRDLFQTLPFEVYYCPKISAEWKRLFPQDELPHAFKLVSNQPYTAKGLPDKDDEEILACAEQNQAHYLLTFNLRDFPQTLTAVKIISPDEFLCEHAEKIQNPYNVSWEEFTARLNRARLHKLSKKLSVR